MRPTPSPTVSRRWVLLGGACTPALALAAACTGDADAPPPDPDRVALEAARAIELDLSEVVARLEIDAADGGAAAGVDVLMVQDAVAAHVAALDSALGQQQITTSPAPSGSRAATSTDAVRAADRAADAHLRAVRAASAEITPLLASIAASDAAVAAYLRGRPA